MTPEKTKFEITFERSGLTNSEAAEMVARHNGEEELYSILEINKILMKNKERYPSVENMVTIYNDHEKKLDVYEDGGNITYTIRENEYYTLAMVADDDNKGKAIAGEDALLLHAIDNFKNQFNHKR